MQNRNTEKVGRRHNSTYPKVAIQWLNQAMCIYQSLCLLDSEVLRNRHLRVAAKRCMQFASAEGIGKAFGSDKIKPLGINGSRKK
jgi:hypothetical protein